MDPEIDTWAVSSFRSTLAQAYSVVGSIIFAYWLLTATLSKGRFLKVKSANVALALSGLTFALSMAVASAVPVPGRLFKGVCPILGLPDTLPGFGFDRQTACEAFASGAVPIVLLGLPLILLAVSAVLRIVVSRRG